MADDGGPAVTFEPADDTLTARLAGRITLAHVEALGAALAAAPVAPAKVAIDFAGVTALDSAGAWAVYRYQRVQTQAGKTVTLVNASPAQNALMQRMAPPEERRRLARPGLGPILALVERTGRGAIAVAKEAGRLLSFFGVTALVLARGLLHPRRVRIIAFTSHIERIGLDALPIVGLLSFLLGVVLAYQGADQLRAYGLETLTVTILGVTVLREMGVLITSIMVAGRSGSAFTAEIGTMQINEEVDAMRTLGIDPMEVLVLPRLLAMMIALPLLAFYSNIMALIGGGLMSVLVLDLTVQTFLTQLRDSITVDQLIVGLSKAPVFAFLIAMVGCYCGLNVRGSAESVGTQTTRSVVQAIFLVLLADALFSIFFSWIGL